LLFDEIQNSVTVIYSCATLISHFELEVALYFNGGILRAHISSCSSIVPKLDGAFPLPLFLDLALYLLGLEKYVGFVWIMDMTCFNFFLTWCVLQLWVGIVVFLLASSLRMYAMCHQLQVQAQAASAGGLLIHAELLHLRMTPTLFLETRARLSGLRLQLALFDREFDDLGDSRFSIHMMFTKSKSKSVDFMVIKGATLYLSSIV
jgi:hypothetical protein